MAILLALVVLNSDGDSDNKDSGDGGDAGNSGRTDGCGRLLIIIMSVARSGGKEYGDIKCVCVWSRY